MVKRTKNPLMLFAIMLFAAGGLSAQQYPDGRYNRNDEYDKYDRIDRYGGHNGPREITTPSPSRQHVWVSGDWVRYRGRYEYQPGRWVMPPRKNLAWMPGRWEMSRQGRIWQKGYWLRRNGEPYMDNRRYDDRDYGYNKGNDRRRG